MFSSLKESSSSSSKVNAVIYSILWANRIAGSPNPCASDLVQSANSGLLRLCGRPVLQKTEIVVSDMFKLVGTLGKSKSILDLRFICMYHQFCRVSWIK